MNEIRSLAGDIPYQVLRRPTNFLDPFEFSVADFWRLLTTNLNFHVQCTVMGLFCYSNSIAWLPRVDMDLSNSTESRVYVDVTNSTVSQISLIPQLDRPVEAAIRFCRLLSGLLFDRMSPAAIAQQLPFYTSFFKRGLSSTEKFHWTIRVYFWFM